MPGATLAGTFSLAMDTTAVTPVFAFTASSATLTVAGVTVAGGFSISRSLEEGATVTRVSLTGATVTVGAGLLTLNNGSGSLVLGASGLPAPSTPACRCSRRGSR